PAAAAPAPRRRVKNRRKSYDCFSVGECSPWPWTRSLAMDALNCSLSLLFMSHFPFKFVKQFHEVEGRGARRGAFHDPFLHGGCFGNTNVAVDDRLQHETRTEKILDLLADDFVEILSLTEKGREDENFQSRVVGFADGGDG